MKALPWYFGGPSEVRLTWTSCCDGLHYGVYGLWGSAPTSPTGLWDKCLSPDWLPACLLSSSLLQLQLHAVLAIPLNIMQQLKIKKSKDCIHY